MKKIVLITGGFDPLHSGHIAYFKAAKTLGDMLIVGLNSDDWLVRKKGAAFMPWNERLCIINNLSMVDEVYTFADDDGSAKHFIQQARAHYPDAELIFANGGDRTKDNIPEMDVVDSNLSFVFGVGGENKMNSSSWILQEWKSPKTERPWGYYRVLHQDGAEMKLKELTVNPGCSLSMQRHRYRYEHWFVTEGTATINTLDADGKTVMKNFVMKNMQTYIGREEWHQLVNKSHTPLKVIEIQFGEQCTEEDIERK
jgi:D-beta-D-heptose 7-phosphate kinase/D-beta-D-heptose 1-phosphate adenosyltransferase